MPVPFCHVCGARDELVRAQGAEKGRAELSSSHVPSLYLSRSGAQHKEYETLESWRRRRRCQAQCPVQLSGIAGQLLV